VDLSKEDFAVISIQTNVNSMNAQENLRTTTDFQARTITRLTSGFRIIQSGDYAAGDAGGVAGEVGSHANVSLSSKKRFP
jgi:hypothetical protein